MSSVALTNATALRASSTSRRSATTTEPRRAATDDVDLAEVPHICEDPTEFEPSTRTANRIVGIDVARGVALFGMMIVHIISGETEDGLMSFSWRISSGTASALFATLAGVGIALSSGRRRLPTGRRWFASAASLVVRAIMIALIGLTLGMVIPTDMANVILPYYAVLFILAIPFLRIPARLLGALALVVAVAVPFWSYAARMVLPGGDAVNLNFINVAADPVFAVQRLFLTGVFPALPWIAYVMVGMAIGRLNIRRWTALTLTLAGSALAFVTAVANWLLMNPLGGLQNLADVASQSMALDDFTTWLVWGGDGTVPTTSLWWLGILAPHTGTPFDMLLTIGVATAVLGLCMMLGVVAPKLVRPIAVMGSMPLTMYTFHLLMTMIQPDTDWEWTKYMIEVALLLTFALLWSRKFTRGPLEELINGPAKFTRDLVMGKKAR